MKIFAMLAAVALAAMALTGCVQMHSDTVIKKDGSGTATMKMSLSPGMAEAIKEMEELGMNEDQDMDVPEFDKISKEDLEKAAKGHGVKVTRFEKDTADGNMALDIALEFKDLKGLSYVMGNIMGGDTGDGMGIFATDDGNFVLKEAQYDFPDEPDTDDELTEEEEMEAAQEKMADILSDEEKAQKQMALMGKMMGAMGELDIKFSITVPGEVIESNAPTVEGNTSIWAINAGNMMSQEHNEMEPVIKFSSKGLKITPLKE